MTTIYQPKTCGLARFATEAKKAGYGNSDGTVNLFEAQFVAKKFGKLVKKDDLDAKTINELNSAKQKMKEKYNQSSDIFELISR